MELLLTSISLFVTVILLIVATIAWRRKQLESAIAQEKLRHLDQQFAHLATQNQDSLNAILQLRQELKEESSQRIVAEMKNVILTDVEQRLKKKEEEVCSLQEEGLRLQSLVVELETRLTEQIKAAQEKAELFAQAQAKLTDSFKALSAEALKSNNQSFLELATVKLEKFQEHAKTDLHMRHKAIDDTIKPVKESLERFDSKIQEIEKHRTATYATLTEQIKTLSSSQTQLQQETSNLVKALRMPNVRGRWGEIQLRRVVEMAGMIEHCDFVEQESASQKTEGCALI